MNAPEEKRKVKAFVRKIITPSETIIGLRITNDGYITCCRKRTVFIYILKLLNTIFKADEFGAVKYSQRLARNDCLAIDAGKTKSGNSIIPYNFCAPDITGKINHFISIDGNIKI